MKKAQAAMEFLMTYGWAILVVLVAIGALAYFGVLSPDKFLPSKCTLPSGIACIDHKASATGVTLVIQNGMGYDMSSVNIDVAGCGTASTCIDTDGDGDCTVLANGAKDTYTAACTLTGSKFSGDVTVNYVITDTGLSHNKTGTMTTKIE
ncbi:hypothetical protein J4209_00275 [Candidatus Woesearchaeota archaeon]|nr:hypothetical protein [Candidatus Woesearchaeota archaeon]